MSKKWYTADFHLFHYNIIKYCNRPFDDIWQMHDAIGDTINRLEWCREHKCLPYVMRDIACWDSKYSQFYIDLAAYCNQPNLFKKLSFDEFLIKRHTTKNSKPRIESSSKLWVDNGSHIKVA